MTKLLIKLIVKNSTDTQNIETRKQYGTLAGTVGIILNIFLCIIKMIAGILTGAISVTADAINNLTDAGSSVVTLVGSRMAAKNSDDDHPFGHGRIEYISGLIVSFIIILLGFELFRSSIDKIINPQPVEFSGVSVAILVISILVKLWMWSFARKLGKTISSQTLLATSADSISDCVATLSVLIGLIVFSITGFNIDGCIGIAVSVFIMISGINSAKETINPLLGTPPAPELISGINETVLSFDGIIGLHDLVVHDYGPGRLMISLHAEVPSSIDISVAHDTIDCIEETLNEKFNCESTIHMDPIDVDDERTNLLKMQVAEIVKIIDKRITIHDFRITPHHQHTNIIFDAVLPFDLKISNADFTEQVKSYIHDIDENYFAVIKIDRAYSGV